MGESNSPDMYRYCTSVGIYQGFDKEKNAHVIAVRNPDDLVKEGEKRFQYYYLDEYQFMVWYVCHGEIITEDDMYESAGELWQECDILPKKPIIRSYKELREMRLLFMSEADDNVIALYEVSTKIQPYIISLFDCSHLQKKAKVFWGAFKRTLTSFFLSQDERNLIKYFRKNIGTSFIEYVADEDMIQSGKYLTLGETINTLLKKGYIFPVGWSYTTISNS